MDNLTELTPVCHTWEGTEPHPRTIPCLCRNWGHKTLSCFLTGTQNSLHTTPFLDSVPTTPSSVECPHTPTHMWNAHTHPHTYRLTHTHGMSPTHTHVECPTHIHMWNSSLECPTHTHTSPYQLHVLFRSWFFFSFLICFLLACLSKHWASLARSIHLWAWGHTLVCGQPTRGHP